MDLFKYLKGLFHRVTRGQIKSSCDLVVESIQETTLPAYESASSLFRTKKLASKEATEFASEFKKRVGVVKGANGLVDSIQVILANTVKLLNLISEKSDTVFSDIESTLGMTYQKAMYLRLISAATFANDYSLKFLNYLYVLETSNLDPQENPVGDSLTPAEISNLNGNFNNFLLVLDVLNNNIDDVISSLDDLPDAVVSEQSDHVLGGSLGERKIDPFGMRGLVLPVSVGVNYNPFHLLGMLVADFRVTQYKCSKEQVELLQLRKLNLEKLQAKKPDARLQKQIDDLANRVKHLNYQLDQMKEKYA